MNRISFLNRGYAFKGLLAVKMAAMPIYGKNPSKIFSESGGPISKKLGIKPQWLKYYNVYINHDPVVTLTYFMTRST